MTRPIHLQPFNLLFQLSKYVSLQISYVTLTGDELPRLIIQAYRLNSSLSDFELTGQYYTDEVLSPYLTAAKIVKGYDFLHLKSMAEVDFNNLLIDVKYLSSRYNSILLLSDNNFKLSDFIELANNFKRII